MDPRTRLLGLLAVAVLAVVLEHPLPLAVLALLGAWAFARSGLTPTWRRRGLLLVAAVVWGTTLSQGLFYAEEPRVALLRVGPLVLWREGVQWGLVQSLRMVAITLTGLALTTSTPNDRLFSALVSLRVPWSLAFLAATALRFLPRMVEEMATVRRARARRGRPIRQRSLWAWMRLELAMLRPVLARALRRARTLAESLDTRGFAPDSPRAVRRPLRMAWWEPVALFGLALVVAGAVSARALYGLYVIDLYYAAGLRPLYAFVRSWM